MLHTLIGIGSTALVAAVPYPGKGQGTKIKQPWGWGGYTCPDQRDASSILVTDPYTKANVCCAAGEVLTGLMAS